MSASHLYQALAVLAQARREAGASLLSGEWRFTADGRVFRGDRQMFVHSGRRIGQSAWRRAVAEYRSAHASINVAPSKQCLSCGAYTRPDGSLPCDH